MSSTLFIRMALVMALLSMIACAQPDNTGSANLTSSEEFTAQVWNGGNVAMIDATVATGFVRHNPSTWDPPMIEGTEDFKAYVTQVRTDFADFQVQVHSRIAQGNMVAANWTVTGTHSESGKEISVDGITLSRFADGMLAKEWVSWDTYSLMQQLGRVEPPQITTK